MALPPLTHHDIIGLIEPFTALGKRVDLDASNRLERRLVFKPVEHPDEGVTEALELHHVYRGTYRLTRVLTRTQTRLSSNLVVEGPEVAGVLARLERVERSSQFRSGPLFEFAFDQLIEADGPVTLTQAVAKVGGVTVVLKVPAVKGLPGDFQLAADDGDFIELPTDLISVIGWDWAPLVRDGATWKSKLRLRGGEPARSNSARAKFEKTVNHLAQIFAEPPPHFHDRFWWARWGAAVRRTIPVLTCLVVAGIAIAIPSAWVEQRPGLRLLLMNAPLAIIALSFTLQEMARVEIAPPPRRSSKLAWRRSAQPDR